MELKDKIAIVTGASAGIGKAYAMALAAEGATVIAAARRLGTDDPKETNTLSALIRESRDLPGTIQAKVCDLESEDDIVSLISAASKDFGRLDILVNNAAYLWQIDALQVSAEDWDRMMCVNVRGPYLAIRESATLMKKHQTGSIINITAGAGNFSPKANHSQMLPYAVSKAALNRLSYFMAAELAPLGIAVNALSPGVVASESALKANPDVLKAGTHKPATPEVLGPALIHLAKQTASGITGQILHTDEFGKSW